MIFRVKISFFLTLALALSSLNAVKADRGPSKPQQGLLYAANLTGPTKCGDMEVYGNPSLISLYTSSDSEGKVLCHMTYVIGTDPTVPVVIVDWVATANESQWANLLAPPALFPIVAKSPYFADPLPITYVALPADD